MLLPRRLADRISAHLTGRLRRRVAARFLHGDGLEIGALHMPLRLPHGARVRYVDRLSREQLAAQFPDLATGALVVPDLVDDGFSLPSVDDGRQDFVVANHVLEHAANPLAVMERWWQLLRPGGILFLTVPRMEQCFDRGRELTTVQHMLEDYDAAVARGGEGLRPRCFEHYVEWVAISERHMAGAAAIARTPEVLQRATALAASDTEIHFHTFTEASCSSLARTFAARALTPSRVLHVAALRKEVVMILARAS